MHVNYRTIKIVVSVLLVCPQAVMAKEGHHETAGQAGSELHLSADIHGLLNQEMAAIETGMQNLVPAISAGDWNSVATIAQKISDSFIMKQKLTPEQKHELHRALPARFVEMDQDFHESAAMMAQAAKRGNADVVNFYYFKLNSACVACHKQYATSRFPGLTGGDETDDHRH